MQMKAGKHFPKQKRKQRQLYFQSNTWLLLCDRRDLRIRHRDIQRTIQLKVLFRCFQAWAKGSDDLGAMPVWDLEMSVLRQQEAITLEARIKTDARFRACKKKDWRKWVDDQLQQRIDQANQRSSVDLFSILQPKKMIFKKVFGNFPGHALPVLGRVSSPRLRMRKQWSSKICLHAQSRMLWHVQCWICKLFPHFLMWREL